MSESNVRAVVYARISKDRNGEQAGVTRQVKACRELAASRGWTVVDEHTDNDVSAYSGKKRPAYLAMLEQMRHGEVDAVVCWHPDRLTRNPRELEDLLDVIESRELSVATVQAGDLDLSTPSGRAVARTLVAWGKHESEHKGARTRAAFADAARKGVRHGFTPYGWRTDAEAEVVREVVARLLAGDTLRTITRDLTAREVPTPRASQGIDQGTGKGWSETQVRQLALRPSNAGHRSHKGVVVGEGDWPVLVSPDDQERVTRLLKDPARKTARHGRSHLLSGLATCGKCDSPLRFVSFPDGRSVYRCSWQSHLSVAAGPAEAFVLEVVERRLNAPDAKGVSAPGEAYDKLTSKLATLRGRLDGLAEDYADGVIDRDQMRVAGDRLRKQVGQTEEQLREAERKDAALRARGVDVYALAPERQRALLKGLLSVRVNPATRTGGAAREFDFDRIEVTWL